MEELSQLQTAILMLAAVIVLVTIARRVLIPYPIFLVLGGLGLSLVPNVPVVRLDPDIVFLIFLPPILWLAVDVHAAGPALLAAAPGRGRRIGQGARGLPPAPPRDTQRRAANPDRAPRPGHHQRRRPAPARARAGRGGNAHRARR